MLRYLRVLRMFWATAIAAEMEYRVNFIVAALAAVSQLAVNLFGLWLFYRAGYQPGGWSWHEALMVQGIFTFLQGVASTWLTPNLSRIVTHVQMGTLDFVLLKPMDSQFWLSTRNMSPWGLPDVLLGLVTLGYAGTHLELGLNAYLTGVLPLLTSLVILYALWFLMACTAVWFVKIYNLTEVLRSFLDAGRFPIQAYPAGLRFFFTFVLPVAFLTTVPAEAMLGRGGTSWLIGAMVIAALLVTAGRLLWRFAMRYYTSASS